MIGPRLCGLAHSVEWVEEAPDSDELPMRGGCSLESEWIHSYHLIHCKECFPQGLSVILPQSASAIGEEPYTRETTTLNQRSPKCECLVRSVHHTRLSIQLAWPTEST